MGSRVSDDWFTRCLSSYRWAQVWWRGKNALGFPGYQLAFDFFFKEYDTMQQCNDQISLHHYKQQLGRWTKAGNAQCLLLYLLIISTTWIYPIWAFGTHHNLPSNALTLDCNSQPLVVLALSVPPHWKRTQSELSVMTASILYCFLVTSKQNFVIYSFHLLEVLFHFSLHKNEAGIFINMIQ